MNLELTGKLLKKYDAVIVSDKFTKREFVVELADEINGSTYYNYAAMQLVNNKCGIIDQFKEGDMVKVSFNIKGKLWVDKKDGKERYFSNLDAWRVESFAGAAANMQGGQPMQTNYNNNNQNQGNQHSYSGASQFNNPSTEPTDDLPF